MAKFQIKAEVQMSVEAPSAIAAEQLVFATLSTARATQKKRRKKGAEAPSAPETALPTGVTLIATTTVTEVSETAGFIG
jgi:hypothetical protein